MKTWEDQAVSDSVRHVGSSGAVCVQTMESRRTEHRAAEIGNTSSGYKSGGINMYQWKNLKLSNLREDFFLLGAYLEFLRAQFWQMRERHSRAGREGKFSPK